MVKQRAAVCGFFVGQDSLVGITPLAFPPLSRKASFEDRYLSQLLRAHLFDTLFWLDDNYLHQFHFLRLAVLHQSS